MILVKRGIFFRGCFASVSKGQENGIFYKGGFSFLTPSYDILFDYVLDRKQSFLDYKNVILT